MRILSRRIRLSIGFVIPVTVSIFSVSCCQPPEITTCTDTSQSQQAKLDEPNISKEIAVLIAKARVSSDLDLNLVDYGISEEPEAWVITFNLKPEHSDRVGGQAVARIDKRTGEVKSSYVGK